MQNDMWLVTSAGDDNNADTENVENTENDDFLTVTFGRHNPWQLHGTKDKLLKL